MGNEVIGFGVQARETLLQPGHDEIRARRRQGDRERAETCHAGTGLRHETRTQTTMVPPHPFMLTNLILNLPS
jgi:hypothetical protein